jgi:hypothetical protein
MLLTPHPESQFNGLSGAAFPTLFSSSDSVVKAEPEAPGCQAAAKFLDALPCIGNLRPA